MSEPINVDALTQDELMAMSRADLLKLKLAVDVQTSAIRDQLRRARARLAQSGERADDDWFRRASSALGGKVRLSQWIQVRVGELNAAAKKERAARRPPATEETQVSKWRAKERGAISYYIRARAEALRASGKQDSAQALSDLAVEIDNSRHYSNQAAQ